MFSKIIQNTFKIFIAVFILGCAKPKYAEANNSGPEKLSEAPNCEIVFPKHVLCLNWSWIKKPTDSEHGSLIFKVYQLSGSDFILTDLAENPKVVLWMPSMGHGSSLTVTRRLDTGTYQTDQVFFVMPGEWDIKFQMIESNKTVDEAVVSITI